MTMPSPANLETGYNIPRIQKKVVWKYKLSSQEPHTNLDLPLGARVLKIDEQHNEICLWALVDPEETRLESRHFIIFGTGQVFDEVGFSARLEYITTFFMAEKSLVWHVFELKEK